jgi:exopolysaccharide production protein ExoZ
MTTSVTEPSTIGSQTSPNGGLIAWLANSLELSRGSSSNLRAMEGLRGLAVILVFFVHFGAAMFPYLPKDSISSNISDLLATVGHVGVDLFFVLSGFLIYGSLVTREQSWSKYLSRRMARLYPAFLVVLALYLVLSFIFPERSKLPSGGFNALTYVLQNVLFLPGVFHITPIITVAWSLSYEVLFYILAPIAIAWFRLRSRRAEHRLVMIVLGAAVMYICFEIFGGPARFLMFFSGACVFELVKIEIRSPPGHSVAIVALLVSPLVLLVPNVPFNSSPIQVITLATGFLITCWHVFAVPASPLTQFFRWQPLRWLGNMSYSYYLIHGLTVNGAIFLLRDAIPAREIMYWILLPLIFLCTLITSFLLFHFVERPLSLAPQISRPSV